MLKLKIKRSSAEHFRSYNRPLSDEVAATTAAARGFTDQNAGRWESVAYQQYVRTPQAQLAAVSATLARV